MSKYAEVLGQRIRIGNFPTPFQQLSRLGKKYAVPSLWIKRDDLTDIALGGNKIRKLEFHLRAALNEGADTLLTFGGPQTNHGRLTAAVATVYGLKSILVLDGEKPDCFSGNLLLDKFLQADLRFVGTRNKREYVEEIVSEYEALGHKVFIIPMGGSNGLGTLGYIVMMAELAEQIKANNIDPSHLFVAVGSAGTLAGISLGAQLFGMRNLQIRGIPVFPPGEMNIVERTDNLIQAAIELIGSKDMLTLSRNYEIDYGPEDAPFSGIGYNMPDGKTFAAINEFAANEAIILDPCYTGKAGRALLTFLEQEATAEDTVIFVHTGGAPGLWSKVHMDYINGLSRE
ncbi:MAG TPA: pyridoxal-phosphate dependent enzyme [Clostridiaceae bacterium]|nr:pyridoxal-phosphate dependent enzyme [Clostridiaceae bacterium]